MSIRDQSWRVVRCVPHGPAATLEVVGTCRTAGRQRTHFLLPFDRCIPLPANPTARRVSRGEWRRLARRTLADAQPSWTSLRAIRRAQIRLIPFQLEPVMALVRGLACRFLIADAVGLGKTIQAGLMVAETLERFSEGRILIVAPASLREQWQAELRDRFALEPSLLDSGSIEHATAAHAAGTNPWAVLPLVITSIDYVKRPEVIRSLESLVWDLVVFDEAHGLAGRSDRASAAAALASRARAVVMLSATPHSGDPAAFDRLRSMGDSRGDFPLLTFRRSRSALGESQPRHVRVIRIRPSSSEQHMHDALERYARLSSEQTDSPGARLAISVLTRRALSSASSFAVSLQRRIFWLAGDAVQSPSEDQLLLPFPAARDDDGVPDAELASPALRDRADELTRLRAILDLAREASYEESKLAALRRLLDRIDEHAIVFTEYRDTLATVAAALGGGQAVIHGGLSIRERHESIRRFTHGDARLLLATDAASEGLNLQRRCRLVIHLEMPWTPLRIEQRVGRVDRLGQTRTVHSIHFLARGTGEEGIASRLSGRARAAEDALTGAGAHVHTGTEPDNAHAAPGVQPQDVERECRQILLARDLERKAAATSIERPFETAVRRPGAASSTVALQVSFADGVGGRVWQSLFGVVLERTTGKQPNLSCEELTATDAFRAFAERELQRLVDELRPVVRAQLAREAGIGRALDEQRARLSALILQPGLFDKRYERVRSAQQQVVQHALDQITARCSALDNLAVLRIADARHAFSLHLAPR